MPESGHSKTRAAEVHLKDDHLQYSITWSASPVRS